MNVMVSWLWILQWEGWARKSHTRELCLKECRKVMHDQDSSHVLSKYYHITAWTH